MLIAINIINLIRVHSGFCINDKGLLNGQSRITSLQGLNKYHIGFLIHKWMYKLKPFGFQTIFSQYGKNLNHPEGPVYHIEPALVLKEKSRLSYYILKCTVYLMSCYCLLPVVSRKSVISYHIRWIGRYDIK